MLTITLVGQIESNYPSESCTLYGEDFAVGQLVHTGDGKIQVVLQIDVAQLRSLDSFSCVLVPPP
jgi:hypothetical protein